MTDSFLKDKVFRITESNSNKFKFVHLKIKTLKDDTRLLQIIDMSQEMIYGRSRLKKLSSISSILHSPTSSKTL